MLRFLIALTFFLRSQPGLASPPWTVIDDGTDNGVRVLKREHLDSDILEFRGQGIVESELAMVVAMLTDPSRLTDWIENSVSSKLLEKNYSVDDPDVMSANILDFYHVQYLEMYMPWPFENRDFILKGVVKYNWNDQSNYGIVTIDSHIVEWTGLPEKHDLTRMTVMSSLTNLSRVDDKRTFIDFMVRADPAGSIPQWLTNLATSRIPYFTIKNIRRMVRNGDVDQKRLALVRRHIEDTARKF